MYIPMFGEGMLCPYLSTRATGLEVVRNPVHARAGARWEWRESVLFVIMQEV